MHIIPELENQVAYKRQQFHPGIYAAFRWNIVKHVIG